MPRSENDLCAPPRPEAALPPEQGATAHEQIIPLQQRFFAATQEADALDRLRRQRRRRIRVAIALAIGLTLALGAGAVGVVAFLNRPEPVRKPAKPTATSPAATSPTTAPPAAPPVTPPPAPSSPPTIVRLSSTLLFAGNSAVLRSDAQAGIVAVGQEIRRHGHGEVTVTGYASDDGGHQDALQLSRDRARVVAEVLRGALSGATITVTDRGLGGANPVAPNTTEANRARNRRVEVSYFATG